MFSITVSNCSWGLSGLWSPSLSHWYESSARVGTPLAFQSLPLQPPPTRSPFFFTLTHTPSSWSKYCLTMFFLKDHPLFFFFTLSPSPPVPEPWPHAWTIEVVSCPLCLPLRPLSPGRSSACTAVAFLLSGGSLRTLLPPQLSAGWGAFRYTRLFTEVQEDHFRISSSFKKWFGVHFVMYIMITQ